MQFRNDINGLRAIAVLPVLFFHAQWPLFSGGFLGVDVFFVISGFLITSLIIENLNTQSFSLISFYDRRVRRILPALLFTCIITTVFAFLLMLPYDLKNYGQSLLATVLSANNILLYLTSGYWSLAAEFKPLYHTWSLAVEEQYYLLIPILLLLAFKVFKKSQTFVMFSIIFMLLIVSFSLSLMSDNKEFNFLIISHRMWELLAGSACALIAPYIKTSKNELALIGLMAILISYFFPYLISSNQAIYTLVPVVGTMMIILFSSNNSFLGTVLSIKPMTIIGSISYSIYLLHMPLLAFLRLSTEGPVTVSTQLVTVFISLPLAYISWRYVEVIFKNSSIISHRLFYSLHVILAIALVIIGYSLHKTYGLETLKAGHQNTISQQHYTDAPKQLIKTNFTNQTQKNLLIIGNSFARDIINMLIENNVKSHYEIIYQPTLDSALKNKLLKQADTVLVVSSQGLKYEVKATRLRNSSLKLHHFFEQNAHDNVYYVGTINFGYNNNFIRRKQLFENKTFIYNYRVSPNPAPILANQIEKSIWQDRYIDIFSSLIDAQKKVPMFTEQGQLISYDTNHITPAGAKYVGKVLLNKTQLGEVLDINP